MLTVMKSLKCFFSSSTVKPVFSQSSEAMSTPLIVVTLSFSLPFVLNGWQHIAPIVKIKIKVFRHFFSIV